MSPKSVWGLESWLLCPDLAIFQWKCCVLYPPRSAAVSKTEHKHSPQTMREIGNKWPSEMRKCAVFKTSAPFSFYFQLSSFSLYLDQVENPFLKIIFKHHCKQLFLFNKAITASLFFRRRGRSWNRRGCLRSWITVINRWSSTCLSQAPIVRATAYQNMMLFPPSILLEFQCIV